MAELSLSQEELFARSGINQAERSHGCTFASADKEDLVSETLLRFYSKGYPALHPIKTIAYHVAVDSLKAKRTTGSIEDLADIPFQPTSVDSHGEMVEYIMGVISASQRLILEALLRGVPANSKDLSADTGFSAKTIRQYLTDIRKSVNHSLHAALWDELRQLASGTLQGNDLSFMRMELPTYQRHVLSRASLSHANLLTFSTFGCSDAGFAALVDFMDEQLGSGAVPSSFSTKADPAEAMHMLDIESSLYSSIELRSGTPLIPESIFTYRLWHQFASVMNAADTCQHRRTNILRFISEADLLRVESEAIDEVRSLIP